MEIICLDRAGRGSAAKPAFETLYEEYYTKILFYIYKRIGNREDAEDLAGEVFLYAYDHYGGFNPEKCAVSTWLYIIVNSRVKNYYRDHRSHADISALENLLPDDGDELERAVWLEQLRAGLREAVDSLPERQREVIVMKYFQNRSHKEIAAAIHTSEGNTRVILSRALDRLKDICKSMV